MKRNGIDEMYSGAVQVFASLIIVFGVVILVSTVVQGGGPLSFGILIGILFVALGSGRLYLARRS